MQRPQTNLSPRKDPAPWQDKRVYPGAAQLIGSLAGQRGSTGRLQETESHRLDEAVAGLGVEAVLNDASKGRFFIAEVMPAAVQPAGTFLNNLRFLHGAGL